MDPQSPNKLIATKYCFLILGDDTSYFFFIFRFFFVVVVVVLIVVVVQLFYVIIDFYKNYFIQFFFHEIFFYFSMFRDVPVCSGMFRNFPCSGFYRRPVWTHVFIQKSLNLQAAKI